MCDPTLWMLGRYLSAPGELTKIVTRNITLASLIHIHYTHIGFKYSRILCFRYTRETIERSFINSDNDLKICIIN